MAETSFDKSALAWTLPWDADWVTAVSYIGSSRRVAAGNNLGQILVWELPEKPGGDAPKPIRRLDGHTNVISRLLSTADGRWLISSSYDHTIRFWDMQAPAAGHETVVLNATTIADASSPRGRGAGKKIPPPIEAKVQLQQSARVFAGHKEWVTAMCLTRDEKLLFSGDDGGYVIVSEPTTGKEVRRWKVKGWVNAIALSPDNKQAFVSERMPLIFDSGRHSGASLWDAEAGQVQVTLKEPFTKEHFSSALYSPDGKTLVVGRGGEADGKTYLIDLPSGKKRADASAGHESGVTDLKLHPDGKHFASSGRDTMVRIFQLADGKQVKELGKGRGGQFKDWIHAISFSLDGRWIAGADMAGQVHVWSLGA